MKKNRNRLVLLRLLCVVLAVTMLFLSAGCQTTPAPEEPPISSEEGVSSLPESTPAEGEEVSEIPAESAAESQSTPGENLPLAAESTSESSENQASASQPSEEPSSGAPGLPPFSREEPATLSGQVQFLSIPNSSAFRVLPNGHLYVGLYNNRKLEEYHMILGSNEMSKLPDDIPLGWRYIALEDDWIYYTDGNDPVDYFDSLETLYRMRIDGSEQTKMEGTFGIEPFGPTPKVFGDWLYFTSQNTLRRISLDGSECQAVLEMGTEDFTYLLTAQGIFFSKFQRNLEEYQNRIFFCDLDGKNLKELYYAPGKHLDLIDIEGDFLYFTALDSTGSTICRIRTDGSDFLQLTDPLLQIHHPTVRDGFAYFITYSPHHQLLLARTNPNQKETQVLASGIPDYLRANFEIHGDFIYYSTKKDSQQAGLQVLNFCRMNLDGSQPVLLHSVETESPRSFQMLVHNHIVYIVDKSLS